MSEQRSADQIAMIGTRVKFWPPSSWKDGKDGATGIVVTHAICDSDGNWHVLVRFDGDDQWRPINVAYLRFIT